MDHCQACTDQQVLTTTDGCETWRGVFFDVEKSSSLRLPDVTSSPCSCNRRISTNELGSWISLQTRVLSHLGPPPHPPVDHTWLMPPLRCSSPQSRAPYALAPPLPPPPPIHTPQSRTFVRRRRNPTAGPARASHSHKAYNPEPNAPDTPNHT